MLNVLLTGVGGQGTVLLSRLVGQAAIEKGTNVRGAETIGMAQRGGSVVSHLRMGEAEIHSPLIPPGGADLIIAFEPGEGARAASYLRPGGAMVVCDRAIRPVTSSLGAGDYGSVPMIAYLRENISNLIVVDGEKLIGDCGSARVVNVALLGVAAGAGFLPFTRDEIISAIRGRVRERFYAVNEHALDIGIARGAAYLRGETK